MHYMFINVCIDYITCQHHVDCQHAARQSIKKGLEQVCRVAKEDPQCMQLVRRMEDQMNNVLSSRASYSYEQCMVHVVRSLRAVVNGVDAQRSQLHLRSVLTHMQAASKSINKAVRLRTLTHTMFTNNPNVRAAHALLVLGDVDIPSTSNK